MKTKLCVLTVLMTAILITQALAAAIMPEPNTLTPGYPHNADAMWVELPSYTLATATTSVGDLFNITVSANISETIFGWQVALLYNRLWLRCLKAGLTAGTTSMFFLGHTTVSWGPMIDTSFLGNGSILTSESLLDGDSQTGPHSGTLMWAEFQIVAAPTETSGPYTGTFDISTEYYAASQETFFVDPAQKTIALMPYDGVITYSWGQVGFVGVYMNLPEGSTDFPPIIQGQKSGLVCDSLPWRPTSLAQTGYIQCTDWYEIPSCLVRIDPVVPVTISGMTGEGLDFEGMTPTSTGSWPTELNGGLPGDPFYFTAHWEARINVTAYNCSVITESDDDSWLFVDGKLPPQLDLGGTHSDMVSSPYMLSLGIHTIDIFYAERCGLYAKFKIMFSPISALTILDSSDVYSKKSFEDLLRHQAVGIQSFEDLLGNLTAENRTPELFQSLENLTEEQEGLLNSFECMINDSTFFPAEFINLLESCENLLHTQCDIKERFIDMLADSQRYLNTSMSTLLNSTENLLTSDDDLLASFESLTRNLFSSYPSDTMCTVDQQTYFLESYEQLLESQSQLLEKFQGLISSTIPTPPPPPPSSQVRIAIDHGLAWLAMQQDSITGAWNLDFYPVASTAFAVLKFEEYAINTLMMDPFDPAYVYSSNVTAGWKYIFGNAHVQAITNQTAGNPDVCLPDGYGIYFMSPTADTSGYGDRPLYETSIVMMTLEASGHPDDRSTAVPAPLNSNMTYRQIMEEAVDYISWAQNDAPNPGEGGWRYGPYNNGTLVYGFNPGGGDSDNSVSQWPVLGLMSALGWGINPPSWVKSELLNHWLVHSQALTSGVYGGFGYTDNSSLNIARTAAGLIELTYCGVPTTDPRWIGASNYISTNWNQPLGEEDGNIGNFYAMYALMKAAMTAQPNPVMNFGSHAWQDEYDDYLVNKSQNANGSWPAQWDTTGVLSTEWALLILEKIVPPPPPPTFTESFEDLLNRQADRISSFEDLVGLLPPAKRASELLESVENLAEEQEGLLNCFECMINASSLSQDEFIKLLNSMEDLLDRQYCIKGSFMDLLGETKPYLQADFPTFVSSTESLLRSDAQLLEGFEVLVSDLFNIPGVTTDTRISFLESYEQLLESQSQLISRFEQLSGNADPNVAVTSVDVSPATVLQGDLVNINVSVENTGVFAETFNVTVYAGSQVIGVQPVYLDSGSSTNLTFTWDTAGYASGNYTVSASASIVPGEVNTADNTMLAENIVPILADPSGGGGSPGRIWLNSISYCV